MEFSVTVSDSFEASHVLTGDANDRCGSLHGHTWVVSVTLMQHSLRRDGQIPGADGLLSMLRTTLNPYRDRHLNDKFIGGEPSAATIAANTMELMSLRFPRIQSVKVKMGEVEEVAVWRELRS